MEILCIASAFEIDAGAAARQQERDEGNAYP